MAASQEPESTDDLQFDVAEPVVAALATGKPAKPICVGCRKPIASIYYALADKVICPNCYAQVQAGPAGSQSGRVLKALFFGLGAGLLGAVIWFAIRRMMHLEIGLVAILVGFMVGKAVRKGSGGRGGRGYQVLAVVLTYCCIAANYMPDVLEALVKDVHDHRTSSAVHSSDQSDASSDSAGKTQTAGGGSVDSGSTSHRHVSVLKAAGAVVILVAVVFGISLAAPFLAGMRNVIGILIIGFALWEAWKFNRRRVLPISGPYQLGSPRNAPAAGVVL